jgi:hypothetical protein
MSSKRATDSHSSELQSVMEAEDELASIWGNKGKKLNVRTVTSASHPINSLRGRWSDVQSESAKSNKHSL